MQATSRFPSSHPQDRNFFLLMVILAWAAIVSGFGNDIMQKQAAGKLHFPIIIHIHAAVFIGWLVLFTTQVVLIRQRNYTLHKKLGMASVVLIAVMVILGCVAGLVSEHVKYGTPDYDPGFLAVMFGDMLLFGILAGTGVARRKDATAHKRLMLVATLALTDAGTGRWLSFLVAAPFGNFYWTYHHLSQGFWPYVGFQMLSTFTLIAMVGVYDIITSKKLHRVYIWSVVLYLVVYLTAGYLYFNPDWIKLATK